MVAVPRAAQAYTLLAGTYTGFISTLKFTPNGADSTLELVGQSDVGGTNPGWVGTSVNDPRTVYATLENAPGSMAAFSVDDAGLLSKTSEIPVDNGSGPTHLLPLKNGKEVFAAYYTSGGAQSFLITDDGKKLESAADLVQFNGSGPNLDRQEGPHAHEILEYKDEVLVNDLGSDKVWRLGSTGVGDWSVTGYIQQAAGSGPRHSVATDDGNLYVFHELDNTLTQQAIPEAPGEDFPDIVAQETIIPPDAPSGSSWGAAELVYATSPSPYLYASQRNLGTADPDGDPIAIVSTQPSLSVVKYVKTGLRQLRGMALFGDQDQGLQYIAVAGQTGGGVAIYERTNDGADLELRARYTGPGSESVVSFAQLSL